MWPLSPVDKIIFKMESEANLKILLPVFEIKKNEAGKPKVLAAGRRRRGAEKRKEISLLSLSTQAPVQLDGNGKGGGLQGNRKPTSGKACSGCGLTSKKVIGRGETKLDAFS